jgi:N-acetylglucosamine-1-phosphodiester alpha-N-acetylglucosaminidase
VRTVAAQLCLLGLEVVAVSSTAIGFDASGHMMLLVVDGEEDIKAGATLYMMEDIMLQVGVMEAVNLDGGGSSVAEYKGKWVSHPTCNDNSNPCERSVSSITCITSWAM